MNALQMQYIKDVLGLRSVVQPKDIRSIYRIHKSIQDPAYLFFLTTLKTGTSKTLKNSQKIQKAKPVEDKQWEKIKHLVQKINQSLNASSPGWIIEILNLEDNRIHQILDQLLIRLQPKGFIIFDSYLAKKLLNNRYSLVSTREKIKYLVHWGGTQQITVPACTLNPIVEFLDMTDKANVQKNKRQAWEKLKYTFSMKHS